MIKHFEDLGFTVVAKRVETYLVEYAVYRIYGRESKGELYWPASDKSNDDITNDLAKAEIFLHGEVKWDGCSNWHFDEQDRVMLHGCSREDLTEIGEIMGICWDWTAELCSGWDHINNPVVAA